MSLLWRTLTWTSLVLQTSSPQPGSVYQHCSICPLVDNSAWAGCCISFFAVLREVWLASRGSRGWAKAAEGLLPSSQRHPVHHGRGLLLTGFLVLCSFSEGSVGSRPVVSCHDCFIQFQFHSGAGMLALEQFGQWIPPTLGMCLWEKALEGGREGEFKDH